MADVRALLKAKRQEIKVSHPLATYTSSGQLRCLACSTPIKHSSAWEGHIGSKAHRTNVARLKEEDKRRAQVEAESESHDMSVEHEQQDESPMLRGKRKAEEGLADGGGDALAEPENNMKRRRLQSASSGFLADFFSDPSRGPIPISHLSDDEDVAEKPSADASMQSKIDLEYEQLQKEILGDVNQSNNHDTYERATVVAEAELAVMEETPLVLKLHDLQMDVDAVKEKQNDEESTRQRKEQEERELIMDRLLDEERAQEEADQRVAVMKARLEALRKKRGTTR